MAYAEKVYKVKNGKKTSQFTWRCKYKAPPGHQPPWLTESGFPTKKLAEDWGAEQEAAIRVGAWIDPVKLGTPFGTWVEIWKKANRRRPRTQSSRAYLLEKLLLPKWEYSALKDVNNVFAVQAWATEVSKPHGPHDPDTVAQARSLLSSILSGAEDAGYIHTNKLFGRRILAGVDHVDDGEEEVWAQPEEAQMLYQRLGGVQGLMVLTDCYLGLRWGELAGVHRDNFLLKRIDKVDGKPLVRHVIRVDPKVGSLHEDPIELDEEGLAAWHAAEDARLEECRAKGWKANRRKTPKSRLEVYLGPPKNKYSAREVDVPEFLARLLDQHIETWPHAHPFTTPSGTWWLRGNFGRELRPAADGREAIPRKRGYAGREGWEPILPGFTMRGARHTADTWMKEDRVDRALRFASLGWVPKDIEGTYEHITPEMRRQRLDALTARWRRGRRVTLRSVA
ncbi:hypothetical protein [Streptomyces sp. NPDC093223]|uniref:hypothetical protein n=1 Tax=Streptomyces sp. NPDC093223 TaxID=3366033 RepID=UPI003818B58D